MIDLITGHAGVAHISAEQIAKINNSMLSNFGADKVVRLENGGLTLGNLSVEIAAGFWRVNGYDMEIDETTLLIDTTEAGKDRFDDIYIEILQDIPTGIQRAEFVIVRGTESSNPTPPDAPTRPELTTDLMLQAVKAARVAVHESSMILYDETIVYSMVTQEQITNLGTAVNQASQIANTAAAQAQAAQAAAQPFTLTTSGTVSASTGAASIKKVLKNDNTWVATGDMAVDFTSNDVDDDTSVTDWTTVTALTSGTRFKTLFQNISKMMKNVRYIYNELFLKENSQSIASTLGSNTVTWYFTRVGRTAFLKVNGVCSSVLSSVTELSITNGGLQAQFRPKSQSVVATAPAQNTGNVVGVIMVTISTDGNVKLTAKTTQTFMVTFSLAWQV